MKSPLLQLSRLRRTLGRDAWWTAAWAGGFLGLELLARWSRSDVTDALGVLAVVTIALTTWREHSRRPLRGVRALLRLVGRLAEVRERHGFRTGIDLRATPPLRRATPPLFLFLVSGAVLAGALLALGVGAFPTTARSVLISVSGAAYLVLLSVLWSVLAAMTVAGVVLPAFLAREAINHSLRFGGERARALKSSFTFTYLSVVLLGMAWGPTWVPLALFGACTALASGLSFVAARPGLDVLWRPNNSDAEPAAMGWTTQALTQAWLFAGVATSLVLLTCGDRLVGAGSATTSLTAMFGHGFAWAAAALFVVLVLDLALAVYAGRFRNPALPLPTRVRVVPSAEGGPGASRGTASGDGSEERSEEGGPAAVRSALEAAGFDVAFEDDRRGPVDVEIRLLTVEPGVPSAVTARGIETLEEGFGTWPLPVQLAELGDPELHARLRRRDEILRRRRLLHGLERLFRSVPRRAFKRGSGTWIAPHYWFITRMSRDVEEEDELLSGPPYHPTIPLASRQHLHEVLRAVEIDILFVEDGVRFRRLKRVFRMLFEYYDLFGGQRRAEDRQFVGLPGLRVVIHEFDFERPYRSTSYPEPDYEDLGRARILHVFRDRGDESVDDLVPTDAGRRPEPVLLH